MEKSITDKNDFRCMQIVVYLLQLLSQKHDQGNYYK